MLPLDIAILEILWYPCLMKGVKLWLKTGLYRLATVYFRGSAFIFEYKDRLVVTDESLCLTEHGDGKTAPYGVEMRFLG